MSESSRAIGRVEGFFLWCSGAQRGLLARKECEGERGKYAGMGAAVLFTAVLAGLSGGYALATIFGDAALAIGFGALWAAGIGNLDRLIASQIVKKNLGRKEPLKVKVQAWLSLLLLALPRICLAGVIAMTVAIPITLRLFQPEIEADLAIERTRLAAAAEKDLDREFGEIATLEGKAAKLRQEIADRERDRQSFQDKIDEEHAGHSGSGLSGLYGAGEHYKFLVAQLARQDAELKSFREETKAQIQAADQRREQLVAERDARRQAIRDTQARAGLLARLAALERLERSNPRIRSATQLVTMVLCLLELTPVIVKLFGYGPYDALLEEQTGAVVSTQARKAAEMEEEAEADAEARRRTAAVLREWRAKQALEVRLQAEHSKAMKNARVALVKDHVEAVAAELREDLRRSYSANRLETDRLRREAVREADRKSRQREREVFEIEQRLNGERHRAMETLTQQMREKRDPLTAAVKGEEKRAENVEM